MCPRPPLSTPLRRFFMTPPSKKFYDPPLAPKSLHTYGLKSWIKCSSKEDLLSSLVQKDHMNYITEFATELAR